LLVAAVVETLRAFNMLRAVELVAIEAVLATSCQEGEPPQKHLLLQLRELPTQLQLARVVPQPLKDLTPFLLQSLALVGVGGLVTLVVKVEFQAVRALVDLELAV
jgi:hypothetical protein